ncbi:MAG: ACT domain-containing protein [Candidatus Omnitrophica bacterium]|nr:ACT domain-containing protein [Candidatus Omnitrophota bacterium]
MRQVIVTVFGMDRPGIIAAVTEILYRQGCNLEDISMTILEGEFAMMMVVMVKSMAAGRQILQRFQCGLKRKWGLTVICHELRNRLKRGEKHKKDSDTYLLSAIGRDKTGIVYKVSRLIAQYGLNITDLNCRILGYGSKAVYAMMLEIDVPRSLNLKKFEKSLYSLSRRLMIQIKLRPLERIEL